MTPAGGVLLKPPRSEKLTGLTDRQRQALTALNAGPATASGEATSLFDRLTAGGWLTITVPDRYTVEPFGQPGPRPAPCTDPLVLSKFAVLHRDPAGLVIEHPLSWCDVRVHDPALLTLLGTPAAQDPVAAAFVADLRWCGMLVPAGAEDDVDALSWSAPDLWFHRRSTLGERTVTWERFGPTKWAKGRFPQPPARRPAHPGAPVALSVPDLAARRATDPSLTDVLEDRVSTRAFDDARPVTAEQVAELLYRTARTRRIVPAGDGEELLSRPYPSGGGVYELELYPVVRHVDGLAPGMYHYDSFEHRLVAVADAGAKPVQQLIKPAAATLAGGAEPQLLLVIAARCDRLMWTYQQIGYALVLKDVGVLMQTIYLAATAMSLGACAQGFADTAAFVAATGVDERRECCVGSIVIGSVPA